MGRNIYIDMKDGTRKDFLHKGRPGGSWTNSIKYVEGFAIITDEWDTEIAIPTEDIKEIKIENH